ncbi:MAG: PDZ domain-containing protein [Planctomycetota bacterium]
MRKLFIVFNLAILVSLTTVEPCAAQLGRGGLIRRLFGRNIQEEEDEKKEDKEKSTKEAKSKPKSDSASPKNKKASDPASRGKAKAPTLAPPQDSEDGSGQSSNDDQLSATSQRIGFGLTTELSKLNRTSKERPLGLSVLAVEKGSAADEAGIRKGDQLITVAGSSIDEAFSLGGLEAVLAKGDLIEIELLRKKASKKVNLTVQNDGVDHREQVGSDDLALHSTTRATERPSPNPNSILNSELELNEFVESNPNSVAPRSPLPLVPPAPTAASSKRRSILENVDPVEIPQRGMEQKLQQTVEEQAAIIREQNREIERLRSLLRR